MNKPLAALIMYVFLAASRWSLETGLPPSIPNIEEQCLVFVLVLVIAAASRLRGPTLPGVQGWRMAGVGLLLFGLPAALLAVSGSALPALARVALMALVPVMLVLLSSSASQDFSALLGASLAGMAGCLLLLPLDTQVLLGRPTAVAALIATLMSVSFGSALAFQTTRYMPLRAVLVSMFAPSLLLMAFGTLMAHTPWAVPSRVDIAIVVWDGLELLLLAYLLQVVSPLKLGARFLAVPLVTTMEGFAIVRPALTWRLVLGVVLLAFGSWRLLRHDDGARDSSLSLL